MNTVGVSSFWRTYFTFERSSKTNEKKLSPAFVDLLKVNTLIPLYFCFQKEKGFDPSAKVISLIRGVKAEKNALVMGFESLGMEAKSALDSQAFLQLKKTFISMLPK